jgi:hypothetical protein
MGHTRPQEDLAMKRLTLYLCVFLTLTAFANTVHAQMTTKSAGKLMVVWTSADPEVADKVCLMYTHAAKKYGWFAEVRLVVWGPSQRLLVDDPEIQAKVKEMQEDGVVVEACVACATKLGLVDQIRDLGYEVKGMGVPLTGALKDPNTEVLTF